MVAGPLAYALPFALFLMLVAHSPERAAFYAIGMVCALFFFVPFAAIVKLALLDHTGAQLNLPVPNRNRSRTGIRPRVLLAVVVIFVVAGAASAGCYLLGGGFKCSTYLLLRK